MRPFGTGPVPPQLVVTPCISTFNEKPPARLVRQTRQRRGEGRSSSSSLWTRSTALQLAFVSQYFCVVMSHLQTVRLTTPQPWSVSCAKPFSWHRLYRHPNIYSMLGPFIESTPTRESCWRAIVMVGRNVAIYKFALG